MSYPATAVTTGRGSILTRLPVLPGLMKLRLNCLVAVAAGVGYLVALSGPVALSNLLALLAGTFLASCGTSALNMAQEAERDGLMRRTRSRPIPSRSWVLPSIELVK